MHRKLKSLDIGLQQMTREFDPISIDPSNMHSKHVKFNNKHDKFHLNVCNMPGSSITHTVLTNLYKIPVLKGKWQPK